MHLSTASPFITKHTTHTQIQATACPRPPTSPYPLLYILLLNPRAHCPSHDIISFTFFLVACTMLVFNKATHPSSLPLAAPNHVGSYPAYTQTVKHAPHALRALRHIKTFSYHSLQTIYQAFTSENCEFCHDSNPFLFLITCQRCYFNWLYQKPSTRLILHSYAKIYYGINTKHVNALSTISIIPGSYG